MKHAQFNIYTKEKEKRKNDKGTQSQRRPNEKLKINITVNRIVP